ncbi:hypothetical protein [Leptothoe spongobia]|uniref:hypothetical protein n=1 Tax=Leptothoe spongobia TaxID=2651728 RepID=UPI001FE85E61|nr:hypothetical protein [Leptothoe spongobia]
MEIIPDISPGFMTASFLASFAACFFSSLAGGGAGLILLPILLLLGCRLLTLWHATSWPSALLV